MQLRTDIACLQEGHSQELPSPPRVLLALEELLADTNLDKVTLVSNGYTTTATWWCPPSYRCPATGSYDEFLAGHAPEQPESEG